MKDGSLLWITLAAALLCPTAARANPAPPTPAELGPTPTFDDAVRIGEAALRSRLIDPDSARIEWPYNFIGGALKSMLSKRRTGFFTCGLVNAKNAMGGYSGKSWFLILENGGQVTELDIGETDGMDPATISCESFVKHGSLSPAPATAQLAGAVPKAPSLQDFQLASDASAASAAASGGFGIAFLPTPAGAVIMSVAKNSTAERAGLKAGQVIQSVNGIDLRGMPAPAAMAVIRGLPKEASFVMVGIGTIKVSRP